MADAVSGASNAKEEFQGTIQNHEPLGFHRDKEVDVDLGVGEEHAESQQQSENGSRGANDIEGVEE